MDRHNFGVDRTAFHDIAGRVLVVYAGGCTDRPWPLHPPTLLREVAMKVFYLRLPAFLHRWLMGREK